MWRAAGKVCRGGASSGRKLVHCSRVQIAMNSRRLSRRLEYLPSVVCACIFFLRQRKCGCVYGNRSACENIFHTCREFDHNPAEERRADVVVQVQVGHLIVFLPQDEEDLPSWCSLVSLVGRDLIFFTVSTRSNSFSIKYHQHILAN
jgi:hypothetical protein